MRPPSAGIPCLLVALNLLAPGASTAQELRIGAGQSWLGNDRLGSPLGFVVSVGTRTHPRFGSRLAGGRYRRRLDRPVALGR
jgi:hypothetical protein